VRVDLVVRPDLEVRRGAVWGVGYYGLRSELDRLRKLFVDEELRSDALFAYALAMPAEAQRRLLEDRPPGEDAALNLR